MSKTRYEWTLFDYAIWAAGAVTVPIYETSSAEQVAVDPLRLRRGRRAWSRTPTHAERSRASATGLRELRHVWQIDRRARLGALTAAAPAVDPAEIDERRRRASGPTTWPRSSTPAAPPAGPRAACSPTATCLRHRQRHPGAAEPVPRGRLDAAVPAAGAQLRPADPGRRGAGPGPHRAHRRTSRTWSPTCGAFRPTFVLSVPRVFEKVYNTAQQKAAGRRQGRDLRPGRADRRRLQRGAGHRRRPGPGAASCSTRSSTGWCTASCAPRSAGAATRRSPAAPRSAPGWPTSSAASA